MFPMNWYVVIVIISTIILITGFITNRNLPEPAKKVRIQKFAVMALILMLISFPVFQPYVPGFSGTKYLSELKSKNLDSIDEISKFDREQTQNIEELKREVESLREDVYSLNRYYCNFTTLLSLTLATVMYIYFFRKEKSAE